jgi:hypothetical protein
MNREKRSKDFYSAETETHLESKRNRCFVRGLHYNNLHWERMKHMKQKEKKTILPLSDSGKTVVSRLPAGSSTYKMMLEWYLIKDPTGKQVACQ